MIFFDAICWVLAFTNMVYVFVNLQSQNYAVAWINFWVAFIIIRQIIRDSKFKTDVERE